MSKLDHEDRVDHEGIAGPRREDSFLDAAWLSQCLAPLASADHVRLLLFLTSPQTLKDVSAEFSVPTAQAKESLTRLKEADLVERMEGPQEEYVVNLRTLFSMFEELEKLGSVRPEEHDDPLTQTMGVAVRGAKGPQTRGAALTVVRGLGWGKSYSLGRESGRSWSVGREPRCDVPLEYDAYASKSHAEVRFDGSSFTLHDLGSTNGTNHNLNLIPADGEVPLAHGDLVGIGKTLLLFWDRPLTR